MTLQDNDKFIVNRLGADSSVTTYQAIATDPSMASSFGSWFDRLDWSTTNPFLTVRTLQIGEPLDTNIYRVPDTYWLYDFGVPGCILSYDESYDKKNGLIQISTDGKTYEDFATYDNTLVNITIPTRYAKLWPINLSDSRNCICQSGPVSSTLYNVTTENLMTKLQDSDLMVVCRSGVPYKATGADIKDSLGSPSINPDDNDVSLDPVALGGTGTEQDPYILRNGSANPFGSTTETTETISIVGQSPETKVIWTDNSVDAGTRFSQIVGITDASGNWSGKLNYADIPNSTEDTVYVGKLQIGLVHYQWTVNQVNVIEQPTAVNSVNLIEADPTGDRFTSQSFVASSQVVDGVPVSTKTIDAHVDGTLSRQVKFDEPLESSSGEGVIYSGFFQDPVPQFVEQAFNGNYLNNTYNPGKDTIWRCPDGILPGPYSTIKICTAGGNTVKVYSDENNPPVSGVEPGVSLEFINLTGTFTNITGIDISLNGQDQTFIAEVVLDGVTLIDGSKALNFAAGTNMEGLAGGDTVNQINDFTEPLESSEGVVYSSFLTCPDWYDPVFWRAPNAFKEGSFESTADNVDAYALGKEGADFTLDSSTFPISGAVVWAAYYPSMAFTIQSDAGETVIPESNGDGSGVRYRWNLGTFSNITSIVASSATYSVSLRGITVDGIQIVDEPTALTFATGTDMSALEAGDDVSQPGAPVNWYSDSTFTEGVALGYTYNMNPPSAMFDGDLSTSPTKSGLISQNQTCGYYWTPPIPIANVTKLEIRVTKGLSPSTKIVFGGAKSGVNTLIGANTWYDVTAYMLEKFPNGTLEGMGWEFVASNFDVTDCVGIAAVRVNGVVLTDGVALPTTGTVGSITGTTAALSSSSGDWVNGNDVTTGDKTTSGTVASVADTTATLSSSSGSWVNGLKVTGPQKTIVEANTRLYCAFDSNGNVTDLQNDPQDPPYTTQDSNPGLTFTFPATFPSGQTPDDELPNGTTFTVEVSAENSSSSSGPVSATVQPEPAAPDAPLAGLTTLYIGNSAQNQIINGIDCVNNKALTWFKGRNEEFAHFLFDTVRGEIDYLATNNSSAENSSGLSTAGITYLENGVQINHDALTSSFNANSYTFVNWTFGAAAGYFDVVQFQSSNQPTFQTIPHSLGTKPGFIVTKQIDGDGSWYCYHSALGDGKYIQLNDTAAPGDYDTWRTSDVDFQMQASGFYSQDAQIITYLFAEDTPGVIKCGSLTGAGTQVVCGFRPQWVLMKGINDSGNWAIADDKRPSNPQLLFPDTNGAESFNDIVVFNDNGFTQGWTEQGIYVAIAAPPDTRSQTPAELAETKLKFSTFENRSMVKCGNDAEAARDDLIIALEAQGYSLSDILNYL